MAETSLITLAGLEEYGGLIKAHIDSYLNILYETCEIETTITSSTEDNSKTVTENFYSDSNLKAIRAVAISDDGATLTEMITLKGAETDIVKTRTWTATGTDNSTTLTGVFQSD